MVAQMHTTPDTVEFQSDNRRGPIVQVSVWEGDTEVMVATSGGGEGCAWLTGDDARRAATALLAAADVVDRNYAEEQRAAGAAPAGA